MSSLLSLLSPKLLWGKTLAALPPPPDLPGTSEAYSFRRAAEDPERVPLTQLPVRALMAPPGVPDFFSRTRVVAPGKHQITGKAGKRGMVGFRGLWNESRENHTVLESKKGSLNIVDQE